MYMGKIWFFMKFEKQIIIPSVNNEKKPRIRNIVNILNKAFTEFQIQLKLNPATSIYSFTFKNISYFPKLGDRKLYSKLNI